VSTTSSRVAEPIFAAEGFAKRFGAAEVLRAASVQAWPGRVTLLLGRNGSGKSTLLRCALGLLGAETGAVKWRGRATLRPRVARMAREGLCFVPDAGLAVPRRRVRAHLAMLAAAFPDARRLTDLDPLDVSPTGRSSPVRRIWLPMAGAAAGIWIMVRLAMAPFGAAAGALPRVGEGTLSVWAAGVTVPVVGVCVLLSWIDHLRRREGAFLSALGVSRLPAFIAWAATCLALEMVAAAILAAL